MKKLTILFAIVALLAQTLSAQNFSVEKYREFLEQNKNLDKNGLYKAYPPGKYRANVLKTEKAMFLDSAIDKYNLTAYEQKLLESRRFMVSERLSFPSFWTALEDVWVKDLPVFITTDMMLHSLHMSYDAILRDLEWTLIIPKLKDALKQAHDELPKLNKKYGGDPTMKRSINDVDVYLTVARKLLVYEKYEGIVEPKFSENAKTISEILDLIEAEQFAEYPLFSNTNKKLDFSQFTPRGHYTTSGDLERYFRSMIWLGRTEFYLIAPEEAGASQSFEDVRRQIIDSYLILDAFDGSDATAKIDEIDKIIKVVVGESDNVKLNHLRELAAEANIQTPLAFLEDSFVENYQDILATKEYAAQKILSQVLMSDPFSPDKIKPASAFMLFGQRFVVDSYVMGNVVYDKIEYNGQKIFRLLPSSLDALFALGNDAAADLLEPEFDMYHYEPNLTAMRYLIDSYGDDFWSQTFYSGWLKAIKTLNPPSKAAREKLPQFMQTPEWYQHKMNTQLAAWAQLRHDNLLYAKQSYTGGATCSYPDAYVEPEPDFYQALVDLADKAKNDLSSVVGDDVDYQYFIDQIEKYFNNLNEISSTLKTISEKELKGETLTEDEKHFLLSTFKEHDPSGMCGAPQGPDGWFSDLFYNSNEDAEKKDFVVADVHTAPTDAAGALIGAVMHVGTGPVNIAAVVAENEAGAPCVYLGPVMSYYELVTLNFKRLTDEEWEETYLESEAFRPDFVDLYLADKNGMARGEKPVSLDTYSVMDVENTKPSGESYLKVYPNPMKDYATIFFTMPDGLVEADVSVTIYDAAGSPVRELYQARLSNRNYALRWDGLSDAGAKVPSGAYVFSLQIGDYVKTGKIIVSK